MALPGDLYRSHAEWSSDMSTSTPQGVVDKQADLDAYYGEFTSEKEKDALSVPLRLVAAWSKNDAAGIAEVFTEDGILILPGDVYKKGREEIFSFMSAAFAGPFKGAGVTGRPV